MWKTCLSFNKFNLYKKFFVKLVFHHRTPTVFSSWFRVKSHLMQSLNSLGIDILLLILITKNPFFNLLFNYRKAFDTICQEILFKKLQKSGIRATFLTVLQSYLSNWTQYVENKGAKSQSFLTTCSVPQGSILAPPLFFNLY